MKQKLVKKKIKENCQKKCLQNCKENSPKSLRTVRNCVNHFLAIGIARVLPKNKMQVHKIFDPIMLNILDITICRIKNLLKCLLWRRQISTHVTKTGLKFIKGLVRQITAYLQLQSFQYKIDHLKYFNNPSSHSIMQ